MLGNIGVNRAAARLRRRVFLRALALGLTLPVAARLAKSALAAPLPRPKRFMVFFTPHGNPTEHYNPELIGGDPTNFSLSAHGIGILSPFEKYKQYMNVLQGFKYPKGLATHDSVVACLSNANVTDVNDSKPRTTVEHAIANALGVKPLVLGACPYPINAVEVKSHVFWDGQPVIAEKNPIKAYEALFGGLGQPAPNPGPDSNMELRDALVTLTSGELTNLQKELSALTTEQTKLKIHLDAMQALKSSATMGSSGAVSCMAAPSIEAIKTLRAASSGQSDDFFLKGENYATILTAQLELAANALLCNSAQVVAVQSMYGICNVDFNLVVPDGLQVSGASHHDVLSHANPSGSGTDPSGLDPMTRVPFATAQKWLMQQIADHVLKILDQPDPADPGGHTVLENTLIFMCSEIGDGAQHSTSTEVIARGPTGPTSYLPLVTLGGGGGAVKTQQVINFSADRPVGDIYLSLCQALGVTGQSFGTTTGPVTELLVPGA